MCILHQFCGVASQDYCLVSGWVYCSRGRQGQLQLCNAALEVTLMMHTTWPLILKARLAQLQTDTSAMPRLYSESVWPASASQSVHRNFTTRKSARPLGKVYMCALAPRPHQSGDMVRAFQRLLQNGNGAKATLIAKFKRLHCNKSFPMMRRLFDAVVKPTVSYGCEVWGTLCSGSLQPGLKGMAGLQIAFFRQILKLRKSISPHAIFAELAEAPWQRTWWSQVLRFMHRLDSMDEGSLHPDILSDNIHDALGNPGCCNWAAGVQKQFC